MKILLIRHGDPNYRQNCLTPLGHRQAEALAERIRKSSLHVDRIYASKFGRAFETAEHTAAKLGMEIEVLDFAHEISTGRPDASEEERVRLSPWLGSVVYPEQGINLAVTDPVGVEIYGETRMMEHDIRVTEGFDRWFESQGYRRENLGYRCTRPNRDTVLLFAHGGTISCLLGHFLNTNALHICSQFRISCTGITEVEFAGDEGTFLMPIVRSVNDASHMAEIVYTTPDN